MGRRKIFEDGGERNRQLSAQRSRDNSRGVRELGEIPPCTDIELKEKCRYNLELFAKTCFPHLFTSDFGQPHIDLISSLEAAILHGQNACICLPRGYGKSSICLVATIWSVLFRHRRYVLLIGASSKAGERLIKNIKSELLFNPVLGPEVTPDSEEIPECGGLFPEITYPLRKIGYVTARCAGQLFKGQPTRSALGSDKIILPTIEGSESSGLVIEGTGLNGELRGRNITTSAGSLRPDLILLDDPQTDSSARSPSQVEQRFSLIHGAISGLASVNNPPAILATVTVVEADDLACKLLASPFWRSVRYGVLNKMPSEEQLERWNEYNSLRCQLIEAGKNDSEIQQELNIFFKKYELELIGEMKVTWDAFINPGDISPLQKVMGLYYEDYGSFIRERMNDPALAMTTDSIRLTIEHLETKINNYKRGVVPLEVEVLTCGTDSQSAGIYWCVVGHCVDGTTYVIDYGKHPKGRKTLTGLYGDKPLEECVYEGYSDLLKDLLNRKYIRLDGLSMSISKILSDGSHGPTNPAVLRAIRETQDTRIQPLYGRASSPDSQLFAKRKSGELRGIGWTMPPVRSIKIGGQRVYQPRHVLLDVNAWKSTLRSKLVAKLGTVGSLSVFKDAPQNHKEFFLHLLSEKSSPLSGKYGTIDSWKLLPNRQNHYWDVLNYAIAAGSMVTMSSSAPSNNPRINSQFERKRVRLSDIQKNKDY